MSKHFFKRNKTDDSKTFKIKGEKYIQDKCLQIEIMRGNIHSKQSRIGIKKWDQEIFYIDKCIDRQ